MVLNKFTQRYASGWCRYNVDLWENRQHHLLPFPVSTDSAPHAHLDCHMLIYIVAFDDAFVLRALSLTTEYRQLWRGWISTHHRTSHYFHQCTEEGRGPPTYQGQSESNINTPRHQPNTANTSENHVAVDPGTVNTAGLVRRLDGCPDPEMLHPNKNDAARFLVGTNVHKYERWCVSEHGEF